MPGVPVAMLASGTPVFVEKRGVLGEQGSYVRFVVRCPCHAEAKARRCEKRRNVHADQCRALGPSEPVAFLGAWVAAAHEHPCRETHVKFTPSPEAVRAYFAAHL